jgi:hypothetical protein
VESVHHDGSIGMKNAGRLVSSSQASGTSNAPTTMPSSRTISRLLYSFDGWLRAAYFGEVVG